MTFRKLAAAALLVPALALASCSGGDGAAEGASDPSADGDGATLRIGTSGTLPSWASEDAHVGHTLFPYQAPYDSLIRRDENGELQPMLATSWEYDETRTALTLELRDDVTFSDGAAFDADAVKANLEHFQQDALRQASQLAALDSVEVVDAATVVLHLTDPDPAFEFNLSQAAGLMASPDSVGTPEADTVPVGSGPYVMSESETVAGTQVVFTAREDYWAPELQEFERVEFRILDETSARLNALQSGQIDVTILDATTIDQAEGAGFEIVDDYQVDWHGLILMDRDGDLNPALGDVNVRQAINYAVDREALVEQNERGHGTATAQPFGPESGAYVEELDERYPHDPEKARELLAEAGYADGVTISVPLVPGWDAMHAALRQQLSEANITLESVPAQMANIFGDIGQQKLEIFYFNFFQSEPWVNVQQLLAENTLYNPFETADPELTALIEELQAAPDGDSIAQEINEYVVENAWFVPLYRLDQVVAYDSDAIDVVKQPQQAFPSMYNFTPAA
ncbi:peptide ABC transporter substrate-binding protein [Microbacterium faecale]|uniref:Peptide ABC transporter substrate-binding protein n=1 Tax=Microbacterium faecale TaxID=1804630 RepID=A0A916Y1Z9_9MICO|nr:ABC transporter substrate-binding protein [Microbacterium faecale]GGD26246.1 peptide ABC transporter substrate-binding protein [Microbacterium faecale]